MVVNEGHASGVESHHLEFAMGAKYTTGHPILSH